MGSLVEKGKAWISKQGWCYHPTDEIKPDSVVVLALTRCELFAPALFSLLEKGCKVALTSPHWGPETLKSILELVEPDVILSDEGVNLLSNQHTRHGPDGPLIGIATGGTTGKLKLALHTPETLSVAAIAFLQHFSVSSTNGVIQLPLYHVSGLMQLIRMIESDGQLITDKANQTSTHNNFISLVPTQLERLLREKNSDQIARLKSSRAILLGGAAANINLLQQARELGLPLSPCYGMTETAALVTALRPEEFLRGENGVGKALPHARISLSPEDGRILINSSSLFHGYWGSYEPPEIPWPTGDKGRIDQSGNLHISGRLDALINTGGEKVDPEQVTASICALPEVSDALVCGIPDQEWGSIVVALHVSTIADATLKERLKTRLSRHEVPKLLISVHEIPRTPAGKPDWDAIKSIIKKKG